MMAADFFYKYYESIVCFRKIFMQALRTTKLRLKKIEIMEFSGIFWNLLKL